MSGPSSKEAAKLVATLRDGLRAVWLSLHGFVIRHSLTRELRLHKHKVCGTETRTQTGTEDASGGACSLYGKARRILIIRPIVECLHVGQQFELWAFNLQIDIC